MVALVVVFHSTPTLVSLSTTWYSQERQSVLSLMLHTWP